VPRPKVIVHAAVSLDGKIDGFEPDVGVYYDLIATWAEDATLCGSETILAAAPDPDPQDAPPIAAPEDDERPLLAVVDSRGRVRAWGSLLGAGHWSRGLAFCSATTPPEHLAYLERVGVQALIHADDRVDLGRALEELAERGIATVRIDAGPTLNGLALRAGLVDELSLLIHPAISGEGRPFADRLETGARLRLIAEERRGDDLVWLRYRVED
jgi:2,5-diamino-6-(ribosylamino)-4(3H)-pyrimidinone 5'-phosphate reductase